MQFFDVLVVIEDRTVPGGKWLWSLTIAEALRYFPQYTFILGSASVIRMAQNEKNEWRALGGFFTYEGRLLSSHELVGLKAPAFNPAVEFWFPQSGVTLN